MSGQLSIAGFDFTESEALEASAENRLLLLDTETSNLCNLSCPYCFRDEYEIQHRPLPGELTLDERCRLLDQAKGLGCRAVKIVGAGEPLVDPYFWAQAEYIRGLGMNIVVNTNGITLTAEVADRLYDLGASVILKFNSFKPDLQDLLVDRKGYSQYRDRALANLLDRGFNRPTPTRLGLGSIVTRQNLHEMFDLYRFCRERNIFPLLKTWLPKGGTWRLPGWVAPHTELADLQHRIDSYEGEAPPQRFGRSTPYFGPLVCTQLHFSLYVDILGNVFHCVGSQLPLGNIRAAGLKDLWNHESLGRDKRRRYSGCPKRAASLQRREVKLPIYAD